MDLLTINKTVTCDEINKSAELNAREAIYKAEENCFETKKPTEKVLE